MSVVFSFGGMICPNVVTTWAKPRKAVPITRKALDLSAWLGHMKIRQSGV